jgi:hypothetical protein
MNFELTEYELAVILYYSLSLKPKDWQQASLTLSYKFTPEGGLELRRVEQPSTQDPEGSLGEAVEWDEGDKPSKRV